MPKLFSLSMYFLSFIPLWIIVLFVDAKSLLEGTDHKCTEIISIVLVLVGIFLSLIIQKYELGIRDDIPNKLTVLEAKECKTMTTDYLVANILPLIAFDFTHWDEALKFLVFFMLIGSLCVRHNIFYVNIIMEMMNYKQYDCRLINDDDVEIDRKVISKDVLTMERGNRVELRQINNEYYIE